MFKLKLCKHLDRGELSGLVSVLRGEGLGPRAMCHLHQLVTTELTSERFSRVQLVVKALEKLIENEENLHSLLNSGLTSKLLWWYRVVLELLTCDLSNTPALKNLAEAFFDCFLELAKPGVPVNQLRVILLYLSRTALEPTVAFRLRLEAIRTFNSALESSSAEQRKVLQGHQDIKSSLSEMAAALFTVGDYELQACLTETMCRLTTKAERPDRAREWFSQEVSQAFTAVRNAVFEADCRRFLNFLNSYHADQRRVFTFPCLQAYLDSTELFRPQEENMEEFWIDFNMGSECLTFFVDDPDMRETRSVWESIHVLRTEVNHCSLSDLSGASVLVVDLVKPMLLENFRGQRLELRFEAELHSELSRVIGQVFKKPFGPVSSVRTYPKKTPKKKRLRVLPLSSPSSEEDSVIKSSERSRAEILFDQIKHSTPVYNCGGRLKEKGPDGSSISEVMGGVRRGSFPDYVFPLSSPGSEDDSVVKDGMGSVRKRSFPESGYHSDHTMATPKRASSPADSSAHSAKDDEEIVQRVIVEGVELAVVDDSAYGEGVELLTEEVESFAERVESGIGEVSAEEGADSRDTKEESVKEMASGAEGEEPVAERAESAGEEEFVKERAESGAARVEESEANGPGSTAEEDKSVKMNWEWSAESVEQLPEQMDLQSQSQPAENQVLRFQTEGVTAGVAWKHIFELEGAGRNSSCRLSHSLSWTLKPK